VALISLRDAGPHDIDDLLRIDRSIATDRVLTVELSGPAPEHGVALRWERTKPVGSTRTPECDRAELLREMDRPERFWVAHLDGRAAGFAILKRMDWHPSTGFIQEIYVDRFCRKQGVASALVEAMKRCATERGLRGILWEAQNDNFDAIEFALRRGFAFAGFNDSMYRNGDRERQRDPDFLGIAVFLYWPAPAGELGRATDDPA
jgi:ribosomal protein S18 acetylase RimI-like enzyme